MSYTAILFDMDGVVIDTHHSVTEFWLALIAEHQVELTQADFQQHIYGCPAEHTFDKLFPQFTSSQRQAIMTRLHDYELNLTYTEVPGVTTLLRNLKQFSIPTALVTSGDRWKVEVVASQLGLDGLFTTQVTVNDIRRGKPDPEGYLLAAQRLDQAPERCLVFEDSVSGVKAAVAAGATCIGIRPAETAPALREVGASHTIPDFTKAVIQTAENGREASVKLQVGGGLSLPFCACPT